MDRNPISDLEAVAAMPGLDELGEVLAGCVQPGQGFGGDPVAMLVFLAGRWAMGSANSCDSAFRSSILWKAVRESAARVGRDLPERPPTYNMLHHLRKASEASPGVALAAALPEVTVPLARSIGLLDRSEGSWNRPAPGGVIYGDGSVFAPLSDVTVDDDGTVQGSRARYVPRIAPRFEGKDGRLGDSGLPITVVGCHGRQRWQRVLLGVDLFQDRNEIGSALALFDRIIDIAQGGVSHVVYDRLMTGKHMRHLMLEGVLPVVAMPEAAPQRPHLVLPSELCRRGYRSAGTREKRKGKGARRRSGDDVAPKSRLAIHHLRTVEHTVGSRTCAHDLWALDGALVSVEAGQDLTLDATYLDCRSVTWQHGTDGSHPVGRFTLPCRGGSLPIEIDFAATRPGRSKNQALALADWLRPIPEAASGSSAIEGLRSDSESGFSWLKSLLPRNRAGSLDPEAFLLDVVGAVVLNNAIAWDVHVAQHTECARHEARRGQRRTLGRVA